MTGSPDLKTRLADARWRLMQELIVKDPAVQSFSRLVMWGEGFDACATIAHEVVEEKDPIIARLQEHIDDLEGARDERKALHDSIVAEKDAEIARLKKTLSAVQRDF